LHHVKSSPSPAIELNHDRPGNRWLHCEGRPELLFTENETNGKRLFGVDNRTPYVKDSINDYVTQGRSERVNPALVGTKAAARYRLKLDSGETRSVRLRLSALEPQPDSLGTTFEKTFAARRQEAESFIRPSRRKVCPDALWYNARPSPACSGASSSITMISRSGLRAIRGNRRRRWIVGTDAIVGGTLDTTDIISMPDKWEYPWYAAWDLAFHYSAGAGRSEFAKELILLLREWYMHPNGQPPAHECFGDVNHRFTPGLRLGFSDRTGPARRR
jgi:hypothetical protein